jgi:chromosome segregation ATPase
MKGDAMTTTTTTRQDLVEKMKRQLDEWNREIDTLEGRVSTATGPAKEKLRSQLDQIRNHYDAGKSKLDEIQTAGETKWEKAKQEAEHVWDTLRHSINYLRSQL